MNYFPKFNEFITEMSNKKLDTVMLSKIDYEMLVDLAMNNNIEEAMIQNYDLMSSVELFNNARSYSTLENNEFKIKKTLNEIKDFVMKFYGDVKMDIVVEQGNKLKINFDISSNKKLSDKGKSLSNSVY